MRQRSEWSRTISRRHFLGALGAGAVASGVSSTLFARAVEAQTSRPRAFVIREDRFGRMFPNLDPFFRDNSSRLQAAMQDIGKLGGMMDAKDQLGDGGKAAAIALIVDPALSANNPNNPSQTAGSTFIGQFLDHDMTFDLTSRLAVVTEPTQSPNERTPAFDLDSVYGGGPLRDIELYVPVPTGSRARPTKLRIEHGGLFEDLPRHRDGSAIIADPRNDENMMIAGLQAAVIMFHNKCVDLVNRDRRLSSEEVFEKARQLTTWHYQWMIVHEFLPHFIGQAMVNDILRNGRRFYRPDVGFIPIEFQGAAYRFGHSMVRPSYRANLAGDNDGSAFFGMVFDPTGEGQADPVDLRGGARARRRFIGWQTFFDFGPTFTDPGNGNTNPAIRPNKLIDTTISTPLLRLPIQTIANGVPGDIISLPSRNLLRHITWAIPSGQSIARLMGVPMLTGDNDEVLRQLRTYNLNLDDSTPLWFYALREARVLGDRGQHLGPVGGRIVGEVFIGMLQLDRDSYLSQRGWRPTLPQRGGRVTGEFKMVDFLTFAGVAPDQRGQ
jgi:Animal haem peroxidase